MSALTLAALVLLGCVLAYWTWMWFAPGPEPRTSPSTVAIAGTGAARGLFGNLQAGPGSAAPTGISIRLLGVVAAARGRRGYAVLQLEAKTLVAVREGEDISPGIRLAEIHPDHVILNRNGVRESLVWPRKTAADVATPAFLK